ncbi:MAG: hypothetical protein GPOALKHO_001125 [Sodalis sp.]|nr:MAG: hypothetical protein GPOALKHO_001125 [Sodalis sp.]
MTEEELNALPGIEQEWDMKWEIFRLLTASKERDIRFIKDYALICARLELAILG